MRISTRFLPSVLTLAAVAMLSACGGGGGGGTGGSFFPIGGNTPTPPASEVPPPPNPSQEPVAVSGKVFVVGAVVNAIVCLDTNSNGQCDDGEPVSAATGADGAYSLTLSAAQAASSAPLIAQLKAGLVSDGASYDMNDPTVPVSLTGLSLSAPSRKTAQINPLTTLVQTGVASGLSLERAEASVSMQLAVTTAEIYDYQSIPASSKGEDNALTMAWFTGAALGSGGTLSVIDAAATTNVGASSQLASLNFTGPGDYTAQTYPTDGVVNASGQINLVDTRVGKTAGVATAHDVLYPQVRLTTTGWRRCDETISLSSTLGSPSRTQYCGEGSPSVSFTQVKDLTGLKMTDTVAQIQLMPNPTITGLDPAAAFPDQSIVFPSGSELRARTGINLTQPYFINNPATDAVAGGTTLAALIAARPASSVNVANGGGTASLGLLDTTHLLRLAFVDATLARFFSCESVGPAYATMSNCVVVGEGDYAVSTVNGAQVLVFDPASYPNTTLNYQRTFSEYNGGVYATRKNRAGALQSLSLALRLNGTAFDAMKTQIGL